MVPDDSHSADGDRGQARVDVLAMTKPPVEPLTEPRVVSSPAFPPEELGRAAKATAIRSRIN